jgi:hypothetical protein
VGGVPVASNVRRFPPGQGGELVAHALGARYFFDDPIDRAGLAIAERAIAATGHAAGFGVVDLLRAQDGAWLVLEVGSDGIFNVVDRDFGNEEFDSLLHAAIAVHFRLTAEALGETGLKPSLEQLRREAELPFWLKLSLLESAQRSARIHS